MTSTSEKTEPAALYEVNVHVAVITLNRPKVLNAVNRELSMRPSPHREGGAGTSMCLST
ncbi:hypothetical protein LRS71_24675 [Rhodococcus pyridinivorans]|uniref:hypothetical protein n=1 Tax=Rhodococcus pyridinivorans TaxID=103816 RepID=UPI001E5D2C1D|nr:hypothetical protein [Rhodococcus pyridinivorans]MCD5422706.1 hypothetical protein [Rhodococcus pyridinivorans]